jgi:pyruvate kinase
VTYSIEPVVLAQRCSERLRAIRADLLAAERLHVDALARATPDRAASLRNFVHYLALRRHDIRPLQEHLARLGLSSLGRAESHALYSIEAVLHALGAMTGRDDPWPSPSGAPCFDGGPAQLVANADVLLGPAPSGRTVRIMVTLPAEAARNPALVIALVSRGMNVARINCAHDDAPTWAAMAAAIREAVRITGRTCLVQMDLGGPKLRTGACNREILLRPGDAHFLTRDGEPGMPAGLAGDGAPAQIACTLPDVLDQVQPGDRAFFDDGKIGGRVEAVDACSARIRVTRARHGGSRLRPDKGINFPDSDLDLPALTARDREDLDAVVRHADLVALSFAERPEDLEALEAELRRRDAHHLGLVLKVETQRGFRNLPRVLLAAMGPRPFGVMIARGDLAIECGYERLAEVQEEILWLCEAAHVPAIWATEVLDRLARKGLPTRAEITDAAMAERAECVMLNKGPHVEAALTLLDGILRRMATHQHKKSPTLRALDVSRSLHA